MTQAAVPMTQRRADASVTEPIKWSLSCSDVPWTDKSHVQGCYVEISKLNLNRNYDSFTSSENVYGKPMCTWVLGSYLLDRDRQTHVNMVWLFQLMGRPYKPYEPCYSCLDLFIFGFINLYYLETGMELFAHPPTLSHVYMVWVRTIVVKNTGNLTHPILLTLNETLTFP